jgi:hypothetical protein
MTGAETVLKWFKEYHDMNKTAPTPYEIRCQLEMSIEQEKQSDCISDVSDTKPAVLDVNLSWERGDPHHTIEVFNNGTLMASGWLVKKHDK